MQVACAMAMHILKSFLKLCKNFRLKINMEKEEYTKKCKFSLKLLEIK